MSNTWFQFKQFKINQDRCAMKVTTDACLFGAWVARSVGNLQPAVDSVLDIGTGTGLLSLMTAQQTEVPIDAIELDSAAFEQAAQNMAASPWHDNLFVIKGDAKDMAYALGKKYDVIISNPPFYENELESGNKQKDIAHHSGGLLLEELSGIISDLLSQQGRFYLLLPYKRQAEIESLLTAYDLAITHKTLVRQSTRHDFFRIMIAGKHAPAKEDQIINEIAIVDDEQQYTIEFTDLLKDYYLHL